MSWDQQEIRLAPRERGFHLITDEITRALPGLGSSRSACCIFSCCTPRPR